MRITSYLVITVLPSFLKPLAIVSEHNTEGVAIIPKFPRQSRPLRDSVQQATSN